MNASAVEPVNAPGFGVWNQRMRSFAMPRKAGLFVAFSTWPTKAGSDKNATAKMTGITPAAISLIGRMLLIPP